MATTITGWLFDIYPSPQGITVWLVDQEGNNHCCHTAFIPSFYMHVADSDARRVAALVQAFPFRITLDRVQQKELYSNEEWDVLRVSVHDTLHLKTVVRRLEHHFPHFVFFNSDIPVQQLFLYGTGLFPLAYGEYSLNEKNALTGWQLADTYDAMDYTVPDLTRMTIKNRPDFISPKYRKALQLDISYDGTTYSLEHERPVDVLHSLNRHLQRCDPDIIMTEYGDAILMPMLTHLATQ